MVLPVCSLSFTMKTCLSFPSGNLQLSVHIRLTEREGRTKQSGGVLHLLIYTPQMSAKAVAENSVRTSTWVAGTQFLALTAASRASEARAAHRSPIWYVGLLHHRANHLTLCIYFKRGGDYKDRLESVR